MVECGRCKRLSAGNDLSAPCVYCETQEAQVRIRRQIREHAEAIVELEQLIHPPAAAPDSTGTERTPK